MPPDFGGIFSSNPNKWKAFYLFVMSTFRIKRKFFVMPPGNRERVPDDLLEDSYRSGVVQRDSNGDWRIINRQSKVFWKPKYDSK